MSIIKEMLYRLRADVSMEKRLEPKNMLESKIGYID